MTSAGKAQRRRNYMSWEGARADLDCIRNRRAPCRHSEVGDMFEMVQLLAGTNPFLLAFSVLIFDIPRFTLSLVSLALFGVRRQNYRVAAGNASVSVIIPT